MNPEDQEAMRNMAKLGLTLWRGLIDDGASNAEAFHVLAAILTGMLGGNQYGTGVEET